MLLVWLEEAGLASELLFCDDDGLAFVLLVWFEFAGLAVVLLV